MRRQTLGRLISACAGIAVAAGLFNISDGLASGFGQGNFNDSGEVGTSGANGYSPAPAILDTSGGPVTITYSFTVHRFTGPGHVPYTQAIDLDLSLRVRHILSIEGVKDPGLTAGDPGLPAAAGHPAWDEAFLNAHAPQLDSSEINTTVVPSHNFSVNVPALPPKTTNAQAAKQSKDLSFTVTIPRCGYFEIETGAFVANTAPGGGTQGNPGPATTCSCPPTHSSGGGGTKGGGDYFTVLTRGFVRAVSNECSTSTPTPTVTPTTSQEQSRSTPTPTPTGGVGGIVATTTPTASVLALATSLPKVTGVAAPTPATGVGVDPHYYWGLVLLGLGGVLAALATGVRKGELGPLRF